MTASPLAKIGIPAKPFLFTLDQIAGLVDIQIDKFKTNYVYYEGRSLGVKKTRMISARNISVNLGDVPDWRIIDREFTRWMKVMGFKYHDRGYYSDR